MIPPTAMPTAPLALGVQLTMRGSTSDYSGARLDDLKRDIAQKAGVPVAAIADLRVAAGTVSFTIPKVGGQELVAGMIEHATRGLARRMPVCSGSMIRVSGFLPVSYMRSFC